MQAIPRSSDCLIARVDQERTTVDHIAFAIGLAHDEPERKRLESLGLKVEGRDHAWIKWRCFISTILKSTSSSLFVTTKTSSKADETVA
jgi:hypothetical protein